MTLKTMKPASPCKATTGSEFAKLPSRCSSEYPTFHTLFQERIDPVVWLAARANVATSTARLFAELHGFAGCRS